MRLAIYMAVFALILSSCLSSNPAQEALTPIVPCPAAPELSTAEQRNAMLLPLAQKLQAGQRQKLLGLLKLWALDIAAIQAAYQQLELRGNCDER